jgi:hypothetical protein
VVLVAIVAIKSSGFGGAHHYNIDFCL